MPARAWLENAEVTRVGRVRGGFEVETARGALRAREVLAATNGYTPGGPGAASPPRHPDRELYQIATRPAG